MYIDRFDAIAQATFVYNLCSSMAKEDFDTVSNAPIYMVHLNRLLALSHAMGSLIP